MHSLRSRAQQKCPLELAVRPERSWLRGTVCGQETHVGDMSCLRVGASNTAAGRLAMSPTERPRETARANLNFIDASTPARVRPDAGDPPYHIVLETLAVGRHKLADAMRATSFSIAIDLRSSSGTLTDHTVVDADSRLLQNDRVDGVHHKRNLPAEQHPRVDL